MNIELRNINRSLKNPEAFLAFLYIGGRKAGLVWNRGKGLPATYYHLSKSGQQLISAAELKYKLKQPEKSIANWSVRQSLCYLLDELARDNNPKQEKSKRKLRSI